MGIDFLFGVLTYPFTLLLWLALLLGCSFSIYHGQDQAVPIAPLRLFFGYLGAVAACVVCTAISAYVTPDEAVEIWRVPPDKYWTAMRQEFVFTLLPAIMFCTVGIALIGVPVILRLARAGRGGIGWILLASLAISLLVSLPLSAGIAMSGGRIGIGLALRSAAYTAGAHLLMTLCFCLCAGLPWSAAAPAARLRPAAWLALAAGLPLAYLGLWPVPIEPLAWQAPAAPGYTGAHAPNTRLSAARAIPLDRHIGPESVLQGSDGRLYAGSADGLLMHMQPDGSAQGMLAHTGGRPLGMAFDADGNLVVADAEKGLLSFDADGARTVLLGAGKGGPLHFANALAIAGNGKIYLTDSSMRFSPARNGTTRWAATLDVLEQSATGRVLEYDPATRALRVVAAGLSFANGIVLSADEQTLFVSESGRYRVWRMDAAASGLDVARPSPRARIFLDNLPGYPDNLTRGREGRIWLGFAGQRDDLDAMAPYPFLRKLLLRIPRALWPVPKSYGHVMAFTEEGRVVADLQDPGGGSPVTTGASETGDRLYIQNVNGDTLRWLPRTEVVP